MRRLPLPHMHLTRLGLTAAQGLSVSSQVAVTPGWVAPDSHARKFQLPDFCWPVHMGTASTSLRPPFDSMYFMMEESCAERRGLQMCRRQQPAHAVPTPRR